MSIPADHLCQHCGASVAVRHVAEPGGWLRLCAACVPADGPELPMLLNGKEAVQ